MRIKVLWVGKTQEDWVRRGVEEYAGRIRRYCTLEIAEAKEERGGSPI
jgi:23S rRNA (pseudouridine1915-N3)-methyltransferase